MRLGVEGQTSREDTQVTPPAHTASVSNVEAPVRLPAVLLLLSSVLPPAAAAQRLAPPAFPSLNAPALDSRDLRRRTAFPGGDAPSDTDLILPSFFGGIGTFWLGAYIGSRFRSTPCEDCGLVEGLYGAAIGFGLGAAAGAHLANHREGPFGKSALIGMAIGAAGTAAAIAGDEWKLLLAIPIVQIASAITVERSARRE